MRNWGNWTKSHLEEVIEKAKKKGQNSVTIDQEHTDAENDKLVENWLTEMDIEFTAGVERTTIHLKSTDQKRLALIKDLVGKEYENSHKSPVINVSYDDITWLIQQVERIHNNEEQPSIVFDEHNPYKTLNQLNEKYEVSGCEILDYDDAQDFMRDFCSTWGSSRVSDEDKKTGVVAFEKIQGR